MKIIVGLGNPGKEYQKTRHNAGQMLVEKLAKVLDFPKFKLNKKLKAEISKKGNITLALPTTFMNESGKAVLAIKKYYKIKASDVWIIYDDIDLPLGKIRIRKSGTSAGHKGIESIINSLTSQDFIRFRVGIFSENKKIPAEKFVLQKFTKKEKKILDEVVKKTIKAIQMALEKGVEKAMNEFN